MIIEERHEMKLEAVHPTGAQEWSCPTCGRRFVVQWSPAYNMVVLEPGDTKAAHNGSTGGLRIVGIRVPKPGEGEPEKGENPDEVQNLNTWIEGLKDIDLNDLLGHD